MFIQSCVDSLPLQTPEEEGKLFVVCEMGVGSDIRAKVSMTGNIYGQKPQPLSRPDTFNFALAEGNKDFGVPFKYVAKDSTFVIESKDLQLKIGETYKFRGLGINYNQIEPIVEIPALPEIDTIILSNKSIDVVNGLRSTMVECEVRLKQTTGKPSFYYIVPQTEKGTNYEVVSFLSDSRGLKTMKHKAGFLVDGERVVDGKISMILKAVQSDVPRFIIMNVNHTNEGFYKYNYYISNTYTDPGQISENQAIAALNIKTKKAYGTFSSMSTKSVIVKM